MRRVWLLAPVAVLLAWSLSYAYVEAPFTLGRVVNDSTNIVVMEVVKVNKEKDKNLIYFKKVADLKGKHPKDEIKHNVGTRGFHPREWQTIMKWAEPGKKAIFFYNGGAWVPYEMSIAECRQQCQVKELPQKVNRMTRFEIRCPV